MKAVTAHVGTADGTRVTRRGFITSALLLLAGALVGRSAWRGRSLGCVAPGTVVDVPNQVTMWPAVPEGRDAYVVYDADRFDRERLYRIASYCRDNLPPDRFNPLILASRPIKDWL